MYQCPVNGKGAGILPHGSLVCQLASWEVSGIAMPQNQVRSYFSNADVQALLPEILFQRKQREAQASEFQNFPRSC